MKNYLTRLSLTEVLIWAAIIALICVLSGCASEEADITVWEGGKGVQRIEIDISQGLQPTNVDKATRDVLVKKIDQALKAIDDNYEQLIFVEDDVVADPNFSFSFKSSVDETYYPAHYSNKFECHNRQHADYAKAYLLRFKERLEGLSFK